MNSRYLQKGFKKQLAHTIEEAGEMLAAAGKTLRWGLKSFDPMSNARLNDKGTKETNRQWLTRELEDLQLAVGRLLLTLDGSRSIKSLNTDELLTRTRRFGVQQMEIAEAERSRLTPKESLVMLSVEAAGYETGLERAAEYLTTVFDQPTMAEEIRALKPSYKRRKKS